MTKFLRKEVALKCPVHTAVREKAAEYLELHGAFCRDTILSELSLEAMAESVRWDYIREFLQNDQGCELIPVSALFFKNPRSKERKESPMNIKPEKYIASGHGKRTAGYASVVPDEFAGLVLKRLDQRRGLKNGVGTAFAKFVVALQHKASLPVRDAVHLQQLAG
jgi:hypothetical protein